MGLGSAQFWYTHKYTELNVHVSPRISRLFSRVSKCSRDTWSVRMSECQNFRMFKSQKVGAKRVQVYTYGISNLCSFLIRMFFLSFKIYDDYTTNKCVNPIVTLTHINCTHHTLIYFISLSSIVYSYYSRIKHF